MSNAQNTLLLNTTGAVASGLTNLSASSVTDSVFVPLTISLAMCLLGGVANMIVTESDYPSKKIIAKVVTSVLLALLVFFGCSIRGYGWDVCGFLSGVIGWFGYPLFYGVEAIIKRRIKNKLEDVL